MPFTVDKSPLRDVLQCNGFNLRGRAAVQDFSVRDDA